jgi:hypothetical protein
MHALKTRIRENARAHNRAQNDRTKGESVTQTYPKRIIEVDLPIARISAHARREKSIRHGHISTLHIWWARRPLAACRAVICASLWPDPEDLTAWLDAAEAEGSVAPVCNRAERVAPVSNPSKSVGPVCDRSESVAPVSNRSDAGPEIRAPRGCRPDEGARIRPRRFLDEARERMRAWAGTRTSDDGVSEESYKRLVAIQKDAALLDDPVELRRVLLDFIADFANWDNSTKPAFLETARALTQAAHEALGGEPGTRPMVVDPFAGGGSIPLEALRVGADAFASDLNPIPVLLNKVVLEYIPKYGNAEVTMPDADGKPRTFHGLADAVRYWGGWIKEQAEMELAAFYPPDKPKVASGPRAGRRDNIPAATPIAYLWARTILSEAPGQGDIPVEVPLMRSLWLAKKAGRRRALAVGARREGPREDADGRGHVLHRRPANAHAGQAPAAGDLRAEKGQRGRGRHGGPRQRHLPGHRVHHQGRIRSGAAQEAPRRRGRCTAVLHRDDARKRAGAVLPAADKGGPGGVRRGGGGVDPPLPSRCNAEDAEGRGGRSSRCNAEDAEARGGRSSRCNAEDAEGRGGR